MNTFVKLNVQDMFDNIQTFKTSDGKSCGSSPIGFKTLSEDNSTDSTSQSDGADFSSLVKAYLDYYAKSYSRSSSPDDSIDERAKHIIGLLDKDNSGTVSAEELKDFKSSDADVDKSLDKQISNLEDQFSVYDKDQDGNLSLSEIKNALSSNCYSIQELGQMADELNSQSQQASKETNNQYSSDVALKSYKSVSENILSSDFI